MTQTVTLCYAKTLLDEAEAYSKSHIFTSLEAQIACGLYCKAALQYKLLGQWENAAKIYEHVELYIEAGDAYYYASDIVNTVRCYNEAGAILIKKDSFDEAAEIYQDLANKCEKKEFIKDAIDAYQNAENCYRVIDKDSLATAMSEKIITLAKKLT
ncbi:MAG: hypothetical protein Harvfovirus13_13 [Harvfovirus sp.]|uniref:Uncharacterized protein n=1 Tax=Harvfovirus sp. TaxID=2487768 RepID=A0A3G5A1B5_9VIRU|nr:MAG: hypothetical protein Harvfovirus13_13 [Harvfovirus sp.]